MARDSMVLPQPDSPTMPSVLPGARVRSTPSTARSGPRGVGRSTVMPSTDSSGDVVISAPGRGSVSARSVSPMTLKASTVRNMKPAGRKASQGAMSRFSRPSPIMLPQLAVGGGTPRPRNESAPSTTMVTATASRKKASSGSATLGSSSRIRMRECGGAERAGRGDELALAQGQGDGAGDAGEGGNAQNADHEGDVGDRLAHEGGHRQHEHQRRERQQHVDAADGEGLQPAAEVARQHAEAAADR